MDPKFTVELNGKTYPLFAGILNEAHERGLMAIETTLVQIPGPDNDDTAIVKAIVRMKDGSVFEDYGDANPRNTNARIATALIRMASTRGKGRALRDAVNIGQTMLEELPDLDSPVGGSVSPVGRAESAARGNGRPAPEEPLDRPLRCSIAACAKEMKPAQATVSRKKFGRLLCPSCQSKVANTP